MPQVCIRHVDPLESHQLILQMQSLAIVNCVMFLVLMPMYSIFFFFSFFFFIPVVTIGIFAGFFVSKKMTQNQLRTINESGVYSTTGAY
jgi:hypothetical protein